MYSPERVTKACRKFGLIPGDSFDLRTGYDLTDETVQAQVKSKINKDRPRLVIGSPPCTWYSRLMQLNLAVQGDEWKLKFEVEREKAKKHIVFCIEIFKMQMARGDYFVMEHPAYADSWKLDELIELASMSGVMTQIADQCMYGLTTPSEEDRSKELPAKKPTTCMSNYWCTVARTISAMR